MNAALAIKIVASPDLKAIIDYLDELAERVTVCDKAGDPRFVELRTKINALVPGETFEHDMQGNLFVLTPSDRLLDLIAKFRALERVMYTQR